MNKTRILIYGDSIAWGRIPGTTDRFDETRFPKVAAKELGADYEIVEEGLRARMLSGENPNFKNRDGLQQFGPIFGSHVPLDLVVIMLGTNDTNAHSDTSAGEIASGLSGYFEAIATWTNELVVKEPKVLLVSPPTIVEANMNGDTMFEGAEAKTKELPKYVKAMADKYHAHFLDASIFSGGEVEGIHIDEHTHLALGKTLARQVKNIAL